MTLLAFLRLTRESLSKDAIIRSELAYGSTKTLYMLEEGAAVGELKWPQQWWLEASFKKALNAGIFRGTFYLAVLLFLLPRIAMGIYTSIWLSNESGALYYATIIQPGFIGDFVLIVVPLLLLRRIFGKMRGIVEEINLQVKNDNLSAPASIKYFIGDQIRNVNEAYLKRFLRPLVMRYLQEGCNTIFARKYQTRVLLVSSIAAAIAIWLANVPYYGPAGLRVVDLAYRHLTWSLILGVTGMFSFSFVLCYLLFFTFVSVVNLVKIPRHRPLRIHYGTLSEMLVSMFSYLGSLLGFASIWILVWNILVPPPEERSYGVYGGIYISIASITTMIVIAFSGLYVMHTAIKNSKRNKLDLLEAEIEREERPNKYRLILGEYRATSKEGTWPVTASILQMVAAGIFSIIGSIIGAILKG